MCGGLSHFCRGGYMYKAKKLKSEIKDSCIDVCGVSDESGIIYTFTSDFEAVENFVRILNENSVERCHVADIAEDMFYS